MRGAIAPRIDYGKVVIIGTIVVASYLVINPIAWLLFGSFRSADPGAPGTFTLDNYVRVLTSRDLIPAVVNSIYYSLGSASLSTLIGLFFALLTTKIDIPFRRLVEVFALLPYMMPMIILAISYTMLFSPNIGIVNRILMSALNLSDPPFNIYSLGGMIFVMALFEAPLSYVIISAALQNVDSSLEESGRVSGSNVLSTLRRITIPLIFPAILASLIVNAVRALEILDIPVILGLPARVLVLPSYIYQTIWSGITPDIRGATAMSVILMVITGTLIYYYRYLTRQSYKYATVTGRGYRTVLIDIGKWKYPALAFAFGFFFVSVLLPLFVIVYFSLMPRLKVPELSDISSFTFNNYLYVFNYPITLRAFINSIIITVVGASLGMLLAFLISYIVIKLRGRLTGALEVVTMLPLAIPSLVMAIGLLWTYIFLPIGLYGTIWLLMIAYISRFVPFGVRSASASILQIHRELEEAAYVCGGSRLKSLFSIVFPLAVPGIIGGWILLATIFLREFSMSILLYKTGSEVLSVIIFDMYINGFWPHLSAIGVIMTTLSLILAVIALRLGRLSAALR